MPKMPSQIRNHLYCSSSLHAFNLTSFLPIYRRGHDWSEFLEAKDASGAAMWQQKWGGRWLKRQGPRGPIWHNLAARPCAWRPGTTSFWRLAYWKNSSSSPCACHNSISHPPPAHAHVHHLL